MFVCVCVWEALLFTEEMKPQLVFFCGEFTAEFMATAPPAGPFCYQRVRYQGNQTWAAFKGGQVMGVFMRKSHTFLWYLHFGNCVYEQSWVSAQCDSNPAFSLMTMKVMWCIKKQSLISRHTFCTQKRDRICDNNWKVNWLVRFYLLIYCQIGRIIDSSLDIEDSMK